MGTEILLCGPIEVRVGGVSVHVGGPKVRTLLAVLALHAGRVVAVELLIDALWGERPPARARALIHTYVSTLRGVFATRVRKGRPVIVRRAPGYVLEVRPDQVDVYVFDEWVAQGRQALGQGRAAQAVERFAAASGLWRGDALGGAQGRWAEGERARVERLRLAALEAGFDAEFALGRHAGLVEELSALVAQFPLRERLRGQLMRALSAAGRQSDALACFQQGRRVLVDEVGIEPGLELQELHQSLLAGVPVLVTQPELGVVSAAGVLAVPRQLPGGMVHFVGRAAELDSLTRVLGEAAEDARAVVISAIGGAGGIGKTTLALHWAHQYVDRFPDGQLFVDLRGFDPSAEPMPSAVAVRGFLDALGVDPAAIPVDVDAQVGLFRSLVADRRMLLVLDNAHDAGQVRPLLPGSPTCTVIVTSRDRLAGLVTAHGARPLAVDVLDEDDARALLTRRLGTQRLDAEPEAVAELLVWCAGLPLALSIAAGRAALHPQIPLRLLADELRDSSTRLGALDDSDPAASVRAVLSWSYAALTPEQAEVFGLLGLAPGPDISVSAAASLTGLRTDQVGDLLRALERVSLLQQHVVGRYRMHDLVHLYAAEQAHRDQHPDRREAAWRRLIDFYLHTAYTGARFLEPHRPPLDLPPPAAGCQPDLLAGEAEALVWLDAEHRCLLASQEFALDRGEHTQVWQLAWTLQTFHYRRGHLHDQVAAWHAGVVAAEQLGDLSAQALTRLYLGDACALVGRHAEALDHLDQALSLAEETGDLLIQAYTHYILAGAWRRHGDDQRALDHASHLLHLVEALDNPVWTADALNTAGSLHARLGHPQARAYCEAALVLFRRLDHRQGQAATLDNLGYLAHRTGQHTRALDYYEQALMLFRDLGNTYEEANTLDRLGRTHTALGQYDHAGRAWQQAIDLHQAQHRSTDADRIQQQLAALDGHRERRGTITELRGEQERAC